MPRKPRNVSATGVYHIMIRGIDKMRIFMDDADCITFLTLLEFYAADNFILLAYCLMGNHLHLLVKVADDALEQVMKGLGVRYVSYFNRRYQRTGPLFQGRFKSQPVTTTGYFLRVLRYIHNNPVKAGLAPTMADYQWSSYRDYFGPARSNPLCCVNTSYALSLLDVEGLRSWHSQPELNCRGFLENEKLPAATDEELRCLIRRMSGKESHELHLYPEATIRPLLRRLVNEEGVRISQLSRTTGISRGQIKRLLLNG